MYLINKKEYMIRSEIKLPAIIEILIKGSASSVKLPIDEFDKFYFKVTKLATKNRASKIYKVRLKDGTVADVTKINLSFQKVEMKDKVSTVQVSKLATKKMKLPAKYIQCIKLIKKGKGI